MFLQKAVVENEITSSLLQVLAWFKLISIARTTFVRFFPIVSVLVSILIVIFLKSNNQLRLFGLRIRGQFFCTLLFSTCSKQSIGNRLVILSLALKYIGKKCNTSLHRYGPLNITPKTLPIGFFLCRYTGFYI